MASQAVQGNSYRDITGFAFPVTTNTSYAFQFYLAFQCDASTAWFAFAVNGPNGATVDYVVTFQMAANAVWSSDVMVQGHFVGYDAMIAGPYLVAGTVGVELHADITGRINTGAVAGTLSARTRSESTGGGCQINKGSWAIYH